ncbi:MAG: hypothetical protein AAFX94_03045 [Myxococcota bacterium]
MMYGPCSVLSGMVVVQLALTSGACGDRSSKGTQPGPTEEVSEALERPTTVNTYPTPDVSCGQDADCAVKDVGSCCGSHPMCVNTSFQPDRGAVTAYCQSHNMTSTCEVPIVNGCACVSKRCTNVTNPKM